MLSSKIGRTIHLPAGGSTPWFTKGAQDLQVGWTLLRAAQESESTPGPRNPRKWTSQMKDGRESRAGKKKKKTMFAGRKNYCDEGQRRRRRRFCSFSSVTLSSPPDQKLNHFQMPPSHCSTTSSKVKFNTSGQNFSSSIFTADCSSKHDLKQSPTADRGAINGEK